MTMTKTENRTPETVLAAIEDDLRRDERMWKQVHDDLRSLGAPRPHRTGWLVAAAVGVLVLVVGSFVLGRNTAPGPATAEVPAISQVATPFTATGLESKREGFAARYGDVWGWGPAVTDVTRAPDHGTTTIPASSLESKREGLMARHVLESRKR